MDWGIYVIMGLFVGAMISISVMFNMMLKEQ